MPDLPYSFPVAVADVPARGLDLQLSPDAAVRAALARHVGVIALPALAARLHLKPEGAEGLHVTGVVEATVRQACGVTLEPFDAPLNEAIDVHFAPAGPAAPAETAEDDGYDPPDEIVDGGIDVGALVAEFVSLGIDPYPRKPGVVFEPPAETSAISPFSALSRLKGDT